MYYLIIRSPKEYLKGREIKLQKEYMERAIELAKNGVGWTNPNPLVGAVIVKNGTIIGEGWHERIGEDFKRPWDRSRDRSFGKAV